MTLLRRTAQLVEDLRTLNVIKESDKITFMHCFEKSVVLRISLDPNIHRPIDVNDIKCAIQSEFENNCSELEKHEIYKVEFALKL